MRTSRIHRLVQSKSVKNGIAGKRREIGIWMGCVLLFRFFTIGVLDACTYRLPVIPTPIGGILDIAIDGKNMLLFSPGDTDALTEQMVKIISNDSLRQSIAAELTLLAHTTFNVKTITEQLERCMRR